MFFIPRFSRAVKFFWFSSPPFAANGAKTGRISTDIVIKIIIDINVIPLYQKRPTAFLDFFPPTAAATAPPARPVYVFFFFFPSFTFKNIISYRYMYRYCKRPWRTSLVRVCKSGVGERIRHRYYTTERSVIYRTARRRVGRRCRRRKRGGGGGGGALLQVHTTTTTTMIHRLSRPNSLSFSFPTVYLYTYA